MKDINNKVDIVIPWVDGDDPKWRKKAEPYIKEKLRSKVVESESADERRYRDWDILRYTFRSIEKYFPWVNKVYLVTDSQKPKWLNEKYSKIEVVDHKQIINGNYLPLFNSSAILLNIYKIPGLSEEFILMNDDMLFTSPIKRNTYFKNGLPKDFMVENALTASIDFFKNLFNSMRLINGTFNKRKFIRENPSKYFSLYYGVDNFRTLLSLPYRYYTGFQSIHCVQPYLKSSFEEVWKLYPEKLQQTCSHKTRDERDVTEWLVRYYQLVSGNFIPDRVHKGKYFNLGDEGALDEIENIFKSQNYYSICLNDDHIIDFQNTLKRITKILSNVFPNKSKFEM